MWYQTKFFMYATGAILVLLIIYLILQLSPILNTIFDFVTTMLFPLIFGGLLYYILRPLRDLLERYRIPRLYAIAIIYLLVLSFIFLVSLYLWPFISTEISEFTQSPQWKLEQVQNRTIDFMNLFNFTELSTFELKNSLNSFLQKIMNWLAVDIRTIISRITTIASYIVFAPFILFFLLKDDGKFSLNVLKAIPKKYKSISKTLLSDLDMTLSGFISGQFIVAIIIGTLMFLGYTFIGLPYAFLLALFALVFNMIPFIGTLISTIPALLVGFSDSPWMSVKVIVVVIIVHALDANLISPNVLSQRLNIHPLTIILLLLACGSLYGLLGLLFATPLYALIKVAVIDLYEEG